MLVLTATTDKIQAVLSSARTANDMSCLSCCRGITTTTFTPIRKVLLTNGVTAVDIVDPPTGGSQCIVDFLSVFNDDTATKTVTIRFNANGTIYNLWKGDLIPGAVVTYQEGQGWTLYGGTYGYTLSICALTSSPADGATVFIGGMPKVPGAALAQKIYIPKSGRITRVEVQTFSGTAGSNEAWSLYVRLNNTTDTLIATLSVSASERTFAADMGITVVKGDFVEIKSVQPTWGTNPLTTLYSGSIYIEG